MRFTPALRQQPLIKAIWILWLTRAVGDRLQGLRRVFGAKYVWILVLECEAQPNVEKI